METIVTFVAGVVLGALSSWVITHRYYLKASAEQRAELQRLSEALRPRNTLQEFAQRLETSHWQKRIIDGVEIWVCDDDNTFQIQSGAQSRDFREAWTTVYPDPASRAYPVYLKIGDVVIKELTFISLDGGRISVPMAEARPAEGGNVEYFWNVNSLEVKVGEVVGSYHIYKSLEGVAQRSRVTLIE